MSNREHSPKPWDFDGPPDNHIVYSNDGNRVCFLTSDGPTTENAEVIVRAVNSYQTLITALEQILANTEADAIPHIAHSGMTAYQALAKDIADCARAALSQAKGA